MKLNFTRLLIGIFLITFAQTTSAALVSDAGTASATEDSICSNSTTLLLTGYTGNIQWQSFNGSSWVNETGTGATTDNYTVTVSATTDYRAVVTDPGFPSDTSNVVTITVIVQPITTGATRCGYGPVTLSATGNGNDIRWYDAPTGGTQLASGNNFTTNVSTTTTYYATTTSVTGTSGTPPIPPHFNVYTAFTRGYWFTAPVDFTITQLYVPTDASPENQSIAVLSFPPGPPPATGTFVFGFTNLFMTQDNPATGPIPVNISVAAGEHIMIIGSRSDVITNGSAINSYDDGSTISTVINGTSVALKRAGFQDNLGGADPATLGVLVDVSGQRGRIEFSYIMGCESSRSAAVATVTSAPVISVTAAPPALCIGQTSNVSVSSSNSNYSYTWSPATGLSGTTGTTVTATPNSPITYTVIADDGTCGNIDSVFIDVGPASVAGTVSVTSDTICSGTSAILSLTGYTGNIQWQSFNGSTWVNETGPGNTSDSYEVFPSASISYQAVVTSGGCSPATSAAINLVVYTLADPVVVNDTICAPGVATLSASGTGVMQWFDTPTGGTSIHTGNSYNPNVSNTTTYYVEASGGGQFLVGPPDLSFGTQTSGTVLYGLRFETSQQVTIDRVWISPGISSGNVIVNLTDTNGAILNTATIAVTAFSGLTAVDLGFSVAPGTYHLMPGTGSVAMYHNTNNAAYPYTSPGNPVEILGGVSPNFFPGSYYYYFYNWEVSLGCTSNRIPVTAFVNTAPPVPTISQNGTILTSSAASNNQWNNNGIPIPGENGTTYDMSNSGSGTYTVTVTIDGCSSTSSPVIYTGIAEELEAAGISVYPNPVKDVLTVTFNELKEIPVVNVYNSVGQLILHQQLQNLKNNIDFNFPSGSYILEIKTSDSSYHGHLIKN